MRWLTRRSGEAAERGVAGEKAAARRLRKDGYRILHRNYGTTVGEIDLICERLGVLVFVEVKTSSVDENGETLRDPADRVDARKRAKMRAAARIFLEDFQPVSFPHRFDIVTVLRDPTGKYKVQDHRTHALDPLPLTDEHSYENESPEWDEPDY